MAPIVSPETTLRQIEAERRWKEMKKALKEEVLRQEAAFWEAQKEAVRDNPAQTCHK